MEKECLNKEKNEEGCPCSSVDCERHGFCCECVRYHKRAGELPACLR